MTGKCGLLVNSSRSIIYADNSGNFDKTAGEKALEIRQEMEQYLAERNLI
jgi:orotidine-5'-phosphate decarboxylase